MVLGLGVACVGLELSLRLFAPQPKSWLEIFQVLPDPLCFGFIPGVQCTVDTGDADWSVRTDQSGRRVDSATAPAPDRPSPGASADETVPVIGDSFVFGHGVDYGQGFVGLLNALPESRSRFQNEGVPGYGPIQYRSLLERELAGPAQPRAVVVVSYVGNDFFDCVWDKHPIISNGTLGDRGGVRSLLKRKSHLYRLASRLWHRFGPQSKEANVEPMYRSADWLQEPLSRAKDVFQSEFRGMRDACEARSVPFIVVLIPPVEEVKHAGEPQGPLQYDLPTRMAHEVLESLHVTFVDATAALSKGGCKQCFLPVDGHLSTRGNEILRDCILAEIRKVPGWQ